MRVIRTAPEALVATLGFLTNLAWELGHSPLYADAPGRPGYILWTRLHCTVGDVLILLGAFWLTGLVFRRRTWWASPGIGPMATFIGLGLGYTIFSEWHNTQVLRSWAYGPWMPLVYGIGLTPILQWILIPPFVVHLLQRIQLGNMAPEGRPGP